MPVRVIDPVRFLGWRVIGETPELWTKTLIITMNRTDMGWLMKIYDLNSKGWECKLSIYVLGKGTYKFDDRRREAIHKKTTW
jgi:hypothetical protein